MSRVFQLSERAVVCLACMVFVLLGAIWTANAQPNSQDRAALQAVGLFQHSCLPFAGSVANLRSWAESKGLHELRPAVAQQILFGGPGKAYNASTVDTKLALVSRDSGACMVVMPYGDKDNVDAALKSFFVTVGAVVGQVTDKISPDSKSKQRIESVTLGKRAWLVSTTTHAHVEMPTALPELIITATAPS